MTLLDRFEKARELVLNYNTTRAQLVSELSTIRTTIKHHENICAEWQKTIIEKRSLVVGVLKSKLTRACTIIDLPVAYHAEYIEISVKALQKVIDGDITSARFSLLNVENELGKHKIAAQEKSDVITTLDRDYKKITRDFDSMKKALKKQRDELEARLIDCAQTA